MMNSKQTKNNQIQFLRGFLCLIVIVFHFFIRYPQIYGVSNNLENSIISYFGSFAVTSFFVLSGLYCPRRAAEKSLLERLFILLKRVLTIWIIYIGAILIIYLISLTGFFGPERTISFLDLIKNIILLPYFIGGNYVDGAHWYIASLLLFYAWFAIAYIFNIYSPFYWLIVLFAASMSCSLNRVFTNTNVFNIIYKLLNGKYSFFIVTGLAFREFLDKDNKKERFWWLSLFILTFVFALSDSFESLTMLTISSVLIVPFYFKFFSIFDGKNPLSLIGDASLSIYLFHQNIGYGFINLFENTIGYWLATIISIIIVLILGVAIYFVFEKQIKRLIDKAFGILISKIR